MSRGRATLFAAALLGFGFASLASGDDQSAGRQCEWTQWGRSSAHDSQSCAKGQRAEKILAEKVLDPFIDNDTEYGSLDHLQVPLTDGDGNVFIVAKTGVADQPETYVWHEKGYRWQHDQLVEQWSFASDWKPAPLASFIHALWQPALSRQFLYLPGAGGTLLKVDKRRGNLVQRIDPFGGGIDPQRYVLGGVTAGQDGAVLYNVVRFDASAPLIADVSEAWLVRVDKHGRISKVDYKQLIPHAPAANALCYQTFTQMQPRPPRPWPPAPQPDGSPTLPPQTACLSQRPPRDATPAIAADGTIYTVSRAHGSDHYSYLIALTPDLRLKWASSLRGHLNDGCGALATPACRPGATPGVDPSTNLPPAALVYDQSTSSPVPLPDGGVVYGAYTSYNGGRGHLMKFDGDGQYQAAYDFGWDITPGVYRHGRSYSLVLKDQYYLDGQYAITQLGPTLQEEWKFWATNTLQCERKPDGTIDCVDTGYPFEWCVATPGIDRDGNVHVVSADGNLYVIGQGGIEQQRFLLERTAYAAYTPTAIDNRGRIYAINNGKLFIVGRDR